MNNIENMRKLFVPYEIADICYKHGFNQLCLGTYSNISKDIESLGLCEKNNIRDMEILAPSYQQVVDWFRVKHKIEIVPPTVANIKQLKWIGCVTFLDKKNDYYKFTKNYKDYYEAFDVAIKQAFKLI